MRETVYTAVIKKEGDWWIGWIEEVPGVNCQEPSREELLETLKITLQEALEFNRQDALSAAGNNYQEEKISLCETRGAIALSLLSRVRTHQRGWAALLVA